jgi:hypothetical protein
MRYGTALPATCLEPLTKLAERVKELSDLSEPDHLCELPGLHDELKYVALDLDDHPSGLSGEELSLQINGVDHLFTEWARLQLLDHLGTREKWFKRVTLQDQARELTRRIHTLDRHRLRRMRTYEQINCVRGLVSASYNDIPDIEVVNALCEAMPGGESLSKYSGKTDKAFYAYAMMRETPLGLGKDTTGYPGVIVKNSEVGATSLWVIPFFLIVHRGGFMAPVAMKRNAMLRKVHRGQYNDLRPSLATALTELSAVWSPLQKRLDGLLAKIFANEQAALDRLEAVLSGMKCTKRFIAKCTTTYSGAKNPAHNGLALLMAVLNACATSQLDSRYDDAEVAGYLLLHLL